jgi:hypothetical protein
VGQDYTDPPPDTPLGEETVVQVVRVAEAFLVQQEPIPYPVRWQPDPELEIDHRRLIQDGVPGILQRRWRVRYENGAEVARALEDEYVAVPPTDKIIGYGTKIVIRQLETPEGTVEYWRVIRMLATSYSASTAGVPKTNPYYGRTPAGSADAEGNRRRGPARHPAPLARLRARIRHWTGRRYRRRHQGAAD